MRKCHIVICGMSGSAIFSHIISQTARFSKVTEDTTCVLIVCNFETFFILKRTEGDTLKTSSGVHAMYRYLIFLDRFSKNTPISNFMKIRPVGTELFHADRRTDGRTDWQNEPNSLFGNFANAPKN